MALGRRGTLFLGLGGLYIWILGGAFQWNRTTTKNYLEELDQIKRQERLELKKVKVRRLGTTIRSRNNNNGIRTNVVSTEGLSEPATYWLSNSEEKLTKSGMSTELHPFLLKNRQDEFDHYEETVGNDDVYEVPDWQTTNNGKANLEEETLKMELHRFLLKNKEEEEEEINHTEDMVENDDIYEVPVWKPYFGKANTTEEEQTLNDTMAPFDNDDRYEVPDWLTDQKKVTLSDKISPESPLLFLNLPNSGSLIVDRYLKCAGLTPREDYGRFFTDETKIPTQVGSCMAKNMKRGKDILFDCGKDFRAWTEMDYVSKPSHRPTAPRERSCFFPSLQLEALESLMEGYPNATIVNVYKNPHEWFETLDRNTKKRWNTYCNDNVHQELQFPDPDASDIEWVKFYEDSQEFMRDIVRLYPSITYIEIDLDESESVAGTMLEEALDVPASCWVEAASKPATDIALPIFVASLPKGATNTAEAYLNCGLGLYEGAHQWTKYEDTREGVTIGFCMRQNIRMGRPLLENCGDHKHWSDIGDNNVPKCFYPTLEDEALQAMYDDYPYGTILNIIRDAEAWVRSIHKWNDLANRWSNKCRGFPAPGSTEQDWVTFYHEYNQRIRDFAYTHPEMTYIEVHADDANQTKATLEDYFGFPEYCWGHANVGEVVRENRRNRNKN